MSSSDTTKQEGLSHIQDKLNERGVSSSTTGSSTAPSATTTTADSGIVGTLKNYLGFSGEGSADTTSANATSPSTSSTTLPDRTREPTLDERTGENLVPTNANASFDGPTGTAGSAPENLASTEANESFETSSGTNAGIATRPDVDTSVKGTEPTGTGSANEKPIGGEESSTTSGGSGSGAGKDVTSAANPRALERPDAIPTAGGEKLGQKHWGESKVVPDNPKPQVESSGIASTDASSEVKDNTSKNTGGATGGPHGQDEGVASSGDGEKEKLSDKIKDKLHIGKK